MRICALGDLLLDVVVRLEEPLVPGADAAATTRVGAGGQAANVAAWAVALGAEGRFVGRRGADDAGALVAAELERRGVELAGPVAGGRNGVVVSLVGPDGDRTMASDRGVAPELRADELDESWLAGCDRLHLTGYSLLREPLAEAAVVAARRFHGSVSVDLSSWAAIRDFGGARFRERLLTARPEVVFANEREAEALGGDLPAPVRVLKRGPLGFAVEREGRTVEVEPLPGEVVDATGAGDALAAGFLVGGIELAREAAARCVAKLGAMP